jgi:hypothetical protein
MTVQYVRYLALAVLLLTILALSPVEAAEDRPTVPPEQPGVKHTSQIVPLDRTTRANETGVQLQSDGGSTLITLVDDKAGDAELHEDGSVRKKEEPRGKDEVLELKKKILELQNKAKLGFRKVVLCSKVEGFGVYSPLPKGKLTPQLVLYFEPANVSTLVSNDRFVIDCTVDIAILDATGRPAGGKVKSVKFHRVARSPVLDLYFRLPINFKTPPQKAFSLRVVLNDNIKNQRSGINFRIDPKKKPQDPV